METQVGKSYLMEIHQGNLKALSIKFSEISKVLETKSAFNTGRIIFLRTSLKLNASCTVYICYEILSPLIHEDDFDLVCCTIPVTPTSLEGKHRSLKDKRKP